MSIKLKNRENVAAFSFLAPSFIGFLVFFLFPFFVSIYYSLLSSPINGYFVGFLNYKKLLENPIFHRAAGNTLIFTLMSVPLVMVLSLGLAMLLLNKTLKDMKIFRTIFIFPLIVPVASVVLLWQLMFDSSGFVNATLNHFGLTAVDWMNSEWARFVVLIVYIWKNVGYGMVLFLAGLQNIPIQYYESAVIDGASSWKRFRYITFVCLTPTTFFVFIISIINSFKVFRETYLISGAYPHESIYMLQHYMNNLFYSLDYQKLTSAAFLMFIFIYILVLLLFKVERKISDTIV